jgi:hypothetical protein
VLVYLRWITDARPGGLGPAASGDTWSIVWMEISVSNFLLEVMDEEAPISSK